jgi:hypothetical protein
MFTRLSDAFVVTPCVSSGMPSVDFIIADAHVVAVEGHARSLPKALQGCELSVPELDGFDGINGVYTEGIVLLPMLYQANTYHLYQQADREAQDVWRGAGDARRTRR